MIPGCAAVDVVPAGAFDATGGGRVRDAIRAALAARERCLLAVPGGSSPHGVFRWLADHLPPDVTGRLDVIPVDERHLPLPDGPVDRSTWDRLPAESNLRVLWEHWLRHAEAPPRALPLDAPGPLAAARVAVSAALTRDPDVVLLGLGPDGHVASLFPGHRALDDRSGARVLAVDDSPKPPPERLTFSLPSLRAARAVIVLARGASKAEAVRSWARGEPSHPLPRLVGPAIHAVIDDEAAIHLETR